MADAGQQRLEQVFAAETERLRTSAALGGSGRLRELFDYLAERGHSADSATQAEIGQHVFGQQDADADDATVRVYVHRLRKRLEEFYAGPEGTGSHGRLVIPAGTYALRLEDSAAALPSSGRTRAGSWLYLVIAVAALAGAFLLGREVHDGADAVEVNAMWQPFVESDRPLVLAVGDYYMFGEIDPVRPEESRLIRDYSIDSPTDLARAQQVDPQRYGSAEDVGLTYLPLSTAYALQQLAPVLAQHEQPVTVLPASELTSDTLRRANVIYVGLVSGMRLLEEVTFAGSRFTVGESYDQLIDAARGTTYTSEEARRLASPSFYRDYGYITAFRQPGGALIGVIAGARETALRGMASIVADGELPDPLAAAADEADDTGFEALYQVTGQQGADLNSRLLTVRPRGAE